MLNLIHMRYIPKSHVLQVCNRMKFKKNEHFILVFTVCLHLIIIAKPLVYIFNLMCSIIITCMCFIPVLCFTFTEINYMSSGYGLTPFHLINNSCSSHPKFT